MRSFKVILLTCALAALTGCANNGSKKASALKPQKSNQTLAQGKKSPTTAPSASAGSRKGPGPAVATNDLAGAWSLAAPKRQQKSASIKMKDDMHIRIEAGPLLSGDYLVQGKYLLILTRDERMRPLAWRINSPDSLTVVRGPETGLEGEDPTGFTLLRAPESASADSEDDEASAGGDLMYEE
jgi:hypothetical protein